MLNQDEMIVEAKELRLPPNNSSFNFFNHRMEEINELTTRID